jgi:hypothetical protein
LASTTKSMKKINHKIILQQGCKVRYLLDQVGTPKVGISSLSTGKVVVRQAWTELPTPASVVERIHVLAKRMPALPIFTGCSGQVIGEVKNEFLLNINNEDDVKPFVDNNNLPGVHTAEADGKIPGVDMVQE